MLRAAAEMQEKLRRCEAGVPGEWTAQGAMVCSGFRFCKMEEGRRFSAPFARKGNGLTKFPGKGGKKEGSVE